LAKSSYDCHSNDFGSLSLCSRLLFRVIVPLFAFQLVNITVMVAKLVAKTSVFEAVIDNQLETTTTTQEQRDQEHVIAELS
jgi:hypothetical protein